MKVATIVPQNYLKLIAGDNYQMCLAHLMGKAGMEAYTKFYTETRDFSDDFQRYVIMDNGVIEGDRRPIEELLDKAEQYGVDELILPDVFRDSIATLKVVDDAMNVIARRSFHPLNFMVVPQGNTFAQWLSCAEMILSTYPLTAIGIPKVLVDLDGRDGRIHALQELAGIPCVDGEYTTHLLGCWQSPLEILTISKLIAQGDLPDMVRGTDSAIAYVYARAGMRFSDNERPDSDPIDFQNGTINSELLLGLNIAAWRDAGDVNTKKNIWFL